MVQKTILSTHSLTGVLTTRVCALSNCIASHPRKALLLIERPGRWID